MMMGARITTLLLLKHFEIYNEGLLDNGYDKSIFQRRMCARQWDWVFSRNKLSKLSHVK